jgi:hypothetical protein
MKYLELHKTLLRILRKKILGSSYLSELTRKQHHRMLLSEMTMMMTMLINNRRTTSANLIQLELCSDIPGTLLIL